MMPGRVASAAALAMVLTSCAHHDADLTKVSADPGVSVLAQSPTTQVDPTFAVADPGPLTRSLLRPDLLLLSDRSLPQSLREEVADLPGVRAAVPLSLASVAVAGQVITVGAVDPRSYRRFTPAQTARMGAVWSRVAAGELAVTHDVGTSLRQPLGGAMTLGNGRGALEIRVGAFASMTPRIDAVVNARRGKQMGLLPDNAMLVSAGAAGNADVAAAVKRLVGKHVSLEDLAAEPPSEGEQTAVLTGGSVAGALGSFRYRYFEDGTVEPDPAWVGANIRSAAVPVLGNVTCHKVLLPQLSAALAEVQDTGLASSIDAGDFGGCYAPRFIGHDPGKGLSLHTWGIALDLNVAGNQRGTVGEIDLGVVAIFQKWGFAWGGDWQYTDPMHFELATLVQPR